MLDLTNVALGLWVVALLVLIAFGIFQELLQRRKERKRTQLAQQALQDSLSRLGITMRDGGEQMEKERERLEFPPLGRSSKQGEQRPN
jgi:hypothetical protein